MGELVRYEGTVEPSLGHRQFLTFSLAEEMFAIGIAQVREIIDYENVTTVPTMPDFVRGVINLRGSVVPVIDLSARFGRATTQVHSRTCIVIMEVEADGELQELGGVVDAVSEVLEIPEADIEPAPSFGARILGDFISGMVKVSGNFAILLDVDKVLAVDEMVTLARPASKADMDPGTHV